MPLEFIEPSSFQNFESLEVVTDIGPIDSFQERPHGRLQRRNDKLAAREKRF